MKRAGLLAVLLVSGCMNMQMGKGKKQVVLRDFAEGRVAQVVVTDRLTGAKEMLFISMPQKSMFLEGYIQGVVTDYDDNPIQGVVVRAVAEGEAKIVQKGEAAFQTTSFDAGVSDSNGIYRIRFSLPLIKNRVDIRGKLHYNPGWEQELSNLGKAYKPQVDETPFRLFFDMRDGMLVFSEGIRKVVVKAEVSREAKGRALPGAAAPAAGGTAAEGEKKPEDDIFKAFFGQ
ncbi:MAG: carboxypeptidase-like regulatory domain-containing protein [Elusimicrobiota bacterium]